MKQQGSNLENWFPLFHGTDGVRNTSDDGILVDAEVLLETGLESDLAFSHPDGQQHFFRVGSLS